MSTLKSRSPILPSLILAATLGLLAFIIYWRGAAPSVATIFDDSLEFPLVVHRLAIAHPTGYPLYTLLGKLFSLFNQQNVAYQLNLMSALFGALAVGLVFLAGLALWPEVDRPPRPAPHAGAAFGALLFGLGPVFYSQATIAEVYTLNACFMAAALLLTLKRRWLWLAFVYGLSLTHHRTMLLLLPAMLVYAFLTGPKKHRPNISLPSSLKLGLAFALPLLLYFYLPLRGQIGSLDGQYRPTLAGFWEHIIGGGYGLFLLDNPFGHQRSAAYYGQLLGNELAWWGIVLGIVGLGILALRRRGAALTLLGLALLAFLAFNLFYTVSDIAVFFIPVFLFIAVLAGYGLGVCLNWLWQKQPILAAGIAIVTLVLPISQFRGQSRADDWTVHDYGRDVLAQTLPQKAAVVGILGEMTLLRYFQETAGLGPDLQTYAADLDADRLAKVDELLSQGPDAAIYLTRELPGAPERWSLSAEGPLIRVRAEPLMAQPSIVGSLEMPAGIDLPLTQEIHLVSYAFSRPLSHLAATPVRLTVVWRVDGPISSDYKISARLLNQVDETVSAIDKVPVHFAYPTSTWRAGEYISDVYDLPLSPERTPGQYTPLLILYDPANNAAEVGRITLPPTYVE